MRLCLQSKSIRVVQARRSCWSSSWRAQRISPFSAWTLTVAQRHGTPGRSVYSDTLPRRSLGAQRMQFSRGRIAKEGHRRRNALRPEPRAELLTGGGTAQGWLYLLVLWPVNAPKEGTGISKGYARPYRTA